MSRPPLAWVALALSALLSTEDAQASVETTSGYTKSQAYNAALRYLRVDLSYEVVERDADAAYLLFKFVPSGRKTPSGGSIEIVERRDGVKVLVRLAELPRYQEQILSDGLTRKLEQEYGEPPRREEPAKDRDRKGESDGEKDKAKGDKKGAEDSRDGN